MTKRIDALLSKYRRRYGNDAVLTAQNPAVFANVLSGVLGWLGLNTTVGNFRHIAKLLKAGLVRRDEGLNGTLRPAACFVPAERLGDS